MRVLVGKEWDCDACDKDILFDAPLILIPRFPESFQCHKWPLAPLLCLTGVQRPRSYKAPCLAKDLPLPPSWPEATPGLSLNRPGREWGIPQRCCRTWSPLPVGAPPVHGGPRAGRLGPGREVQSWGPGVIQLGALSLDMGFSTVVWALRTVQAGCQQGFRKHEKSRVGCGERSGVLSGPKDFLPWGAAGSQPSAVGPLRHHLG